MTERYEWPDNNPIRLQEDQQLLDEIAALLLKNFTPHAVTCSEPDCANTMGAADWGRYDGVLEVAMWLRQRALSALLSEKMHA